MFTLYRYRATVVRIIDGDTIVVDIDLGFNVVLHKQHIRLYNIEAPEVRGEEREQGLVSKAALENMIPPGSTVYIQTYKGRSFNRWIAEIWNEDQTTNINESMVQIGAATRSQP